jgi:3-oxoacyl-[acyl-carrier-protein] synthase II
MSPREVVITGVGVVCPVGIGVEAYWRALSSNHSGVEWLAPMRGTDLPFRYAARIKDFDAKQFIQPRKTIKVMCQEIQTACAAAVLAMQDSGLAKETVEPDRFGVVLGSEMLFGEVEELADVYRPCADGGQFRVERWAEVAFKDLFPLWMLKYLPNMAACHISIAHDARGPNNSIVAGGASSLLAIAEAAMVIERGHADVMLAGGGGSFASSSCLPFRGWNHLTRWDGEPAEASRPFDARRSGSVPGEGAGLLVLETREHAERRGANILARLAGYASRFEAPAGPWQARTGRAIARSIEAALVSAGLDRTAIDHVNAHGDSTIAADREEALAIREVLGDTPVTALKSYFGDLGAGSGAVELIGSVLALARGRVPATLNYQQPDPACPVNVIHGAARPVVRPAAIALNQSNTGQAAAMVIVRD